MEMSTLRLEQQYRQLALDVRAEVLKMLLSMVSLNTATALDRVLQQSNSAKVFFKSAFVQQYLRSPSEEFCNMVELYIEMRSECKF